MLEIYVINLSSSVARRENILRQLAALGLNANLFKAVDGRMEDHRLFRKYDDPLRVKVKGNSLTRGQLGCFASHYLLWEKCCQLSEPVIILEDDADIYKETFDQFYHSIGLFDEKYECIRMFDNHSKHYKPIVMECFQDFKIAKFTKGHMRATGYFLTPTGAKKFLKRASTWFLPVDIYMDRFWDNGVECYGTIPASLSNDLKFKSTIDYVDKDAQKRPVSVKFRRELFSASEQLRRRYHNMSFRIHNHL